MKNETQNTVQCKGRALVLGLVQAQHAVGDEGLGQHHHAQHVEGFAVAWSRV